jgi:hypothetical protein
MLNSCNNSIKPELALSENFGPSVQELESALQFPAHLPIYNNNVRACNAVAHT